MKLPNADDLRSYPETKSSGVEWLGRVPAHWHVRKLRNTLRPVAERNRPDLPLLSVVREVGVMVRNLSDKDENHNSIPDDLRNYKVVKRYQFAMKQNEGMARVVRGFQLEWYRQSGVFCFRHTRC